MSRGPGGALIHRHMLAYIHTYTYITYTYINIHTYVQSSIIDRRSTQQKTFSAVWQSDVLRQPTCIYTYIYIHTHMHACMQSSITAWRVLQGLYRLFDKANGLQQPTCIHTYTYILTHMHACLPACNLPSLPVESSFDEAYELRQPKCIHTNMHTYTTHIHAVFYHCPRSPPRTISAGWWSK